ncbi:MAG TPA: class I SAM-dependent methyltransferase [Vicinamibacterales bacterium]|nr:class I SAM-dependent methyltransferase [Vicinamibacterales bacterium]
MPTDSAKAAVRDFWDEAACGERLYLPDVSAESFRSHAQARYDLEPFIRPFARFDESGGLRVLEIGVGLGADHQCFAERGARLSGVDLTPRAIELTRRRLETLGLTSDLRVGDAEHLDFPDETFDVVYSWGVIHHSPDTAQAVREIFRVLKPGGKARVMIYNAASLVGLMLWLRYGLAAGRPLTPMQDIYGKHLESPGTKAFSTSQARALFSAFSPVAIKVELTHGDLLTSEAGQRHRGALLTLAKAVWPRWFFRTFCPGMGLFMLIDATKPR